MESQFQTKHIKAIQDRVLYTFKEMDDILERMLQTWAEYEQFAIQEGYIHNDKDC